MKVLITGAAGFIGSHLAEALAAKGCDVRGIDSFSSYYDRRLKEANAAAVRACGVELLEGDLTKDSLSELVSGAQFIFHLAAQPGISQATSFEEYLQNNVIATHRLLDAALAQKERPCVVNIATSSIYGKHATDTEEAPPKPTSYYGVTKLAAEQLVLAAHRDQGLPACSFRLFSVYGPRERPEKLYTKLILSILRDEPFPLYEGSEHHSRSFTYVGDVIAAFVKVLDAPLISRGEIVNIGSDQEITTGEGIAIVEALLGAKANIQRVAKRAGDQERTSANISKARTLLGYRPKIAPKEGLAAQVAWMKESLDLFK